jgi:hypothetical protein
MFGVDRSKGLTPELDSRETIPSGAAETIGTEARTSVKIVNEVGSPEAMVMCGRVG